MKLSCCRLIYSSILSVSSILCAVEVTAQVIPDSTTNTTVEVNGNDFSINQGDRAGDNLFHSFSDFSVPTNGSAFFNNASDIVNIFSRVTGGNISNIDGLIRANNANLFLLNPAGIIFGAGARLNIGGSFYGSTADSIVFEEGEFSATDVNNPPLLTINAPIGLNFRDNPADITVRGSSLRVTAGQNLTLVGGNITLDAANLTARGGDINLGGLSTAATVNINEDLSLTYPSNLSQANISLINGASVNVSGQGGGSIAIDGSNLELADSSVLAAGIDSNPDTPDAQAGKIVISASDTVSLNGNSVIRNNVASNSLGNAGNIELTASNLSLDNSRLTSRTQGNGDTGDISINVSNDISLNNGGEVKTEIAAGAEGNAGTIRIRANSLTLSEASAIFSNTQGQGDAGNVTVNVANAIVLEGSDLKSQVLQGAEGDAGNIEITANSLSLRGGLQGRRSLLSADSNSIGDAGNVIINATGDVSLDDDSLILSKVSQGEGNAGVVNINSDRLFLDGRSFIISNTGDRNLNLTNKGNAGDININANLVSLNNFSQITSNALENAEGQPGNVNINTDTLEISNGSNLNALTENNFNGGQININTGTLELVTGGKIVTGTSGMGDAGSIFLNVTDNITIDGSDAPSQTEPFIEQILQELEPNTGLFANTIATSSGDGGSIQIINNGNISLVDGAKVAVDSQGTGNGGSLIIQTNSLTLENQAELSAATNFGRDGGNITLNISEDITLRDNSFISARALEEANGGNLDINAKFIIAFPSKGNGNDVIATAEDGIGGNIEINARQIFNLQEGKALDNNGNFLPNNRNDIDASSQAEGLDGTVTINNPDTDSSQGLVEFSTNVVEQNYTFATACTVDRVSNSSSLTIKGRGGIPPKPIEPFTADNIIITEKSSLESRTRKEHELNAVLQKQYPPIMTDRGEIYPARGIIIQEDGTITLTRYPVFVAAQRVSDAFDNCSAK